MKIKIKNQKNNYRKVVQIERKKKKKKEEILGIWKFKLLIKKSQWVFAYTYIDKIKNLTSLRDLSSNYKIVITILMK